MIIPLDFEHTLSLFGERMRLAPEGGGFGIAGVGGGGEGLGVVLVDVEVGDAHVTAAGGLGGGEVIELCAVEPQITKLLEQRWAPAGVTLQDEVLAPEVIANLVRMSAGNFRLLSRLLTQIERILNVNELPAVTKEIVVAARDSLVIGQG